MTVENQFTPEENDVIQQLRNDPRPKLKPRLVEAIRQEIFVEMDKSFPTSAKKPQPLRPITSPFGILVAAAVIIVAVIVTIIVAAPKQQLPQMNPTVTRVIATPTLTSMPEANATAATTESTLTVSQTPTVISSGTATVMPSAPPTSTGDIIIMEGPVEQINVNIITIFSINIQVDANDPILTQVHVGDNLHVEGRVVPQGNTFMIVAIHVTIVNTIIVNPPPVIPGLPPNCKISKNGHIKCSKQQRR